MLKAFAIAALLVVPVVSGAHHSFASYSDQIVEVEGELTSVRWGNPHVRLTLEADDGEAWTLEAAAVYVLERRGLMRDLFRQGSSIEVAGRLSRTRNTEVWLHNLQLSDGRELLMIGGVDPRWSRIALGGDGTLAIEDAARQDRGVFRVWSQPALRPITFGDALPYRAAQPLGGDEWKARMDEFAARCEPVGMPGVMATPYPVELVDHGSWIQLLGFSNNAPIDRVIYMTNAPNAPNAPDAPEPGPGRFGQSVGRWKTEHSLVVETAGIDWPYFDDSLGTAQSDRLATVERFTLSENQERLDYEMTVSDPELLMQPATAIDTYWLALGESLAQSSCCAE